MEAEVRLRGDEITCVQQLATLFAKGVTFVSVGSEDANSLGLSDEKWEPVLATMEHIQAITGVVNTAEGRFSLFYITANAVQAARAIEEQEKKQERPKDIVAETSEIARSHPIASRFIIVSIIISAILVPIAALLTIIEKVVALFK